MSIKVNTLRDGKTKTYTAFWRANGKLHGKRFKTKQRAERHRRSARREARGTCSATPRVARWTRTADTSARGRESSAGRASAGSAASMRCGIPTRACSWPSSGREPSR